MQLLEHSELLGLIDNLNHDPQPETDRPDSAWYGRTTRDTTIQDITLPTHVEFQFKDKGDKITFKFTSSEIFKLNVACTGTRR